MPDWKSLCVGDVVRLLAVPAPDLQQRDRERAEGVEDAGWTADTIERILRLDPVVTISRIDEYDLPWFDYEFPDGEEHWMVISDDDSWEFVRRAGAALAPEED